MQLIRKYFEKLTPLSETEWEAFSSRLTRQTIPHKTILLARGQTEKHLSFIEKGIIRHYIPGEENDLTFAFSFSNNFVSAYDSFLTQTPSLYQLETLSDTILWSISYQDLQKIYTETKVGNLIGRYAAEELFLKKARRELLLLSEPAEQLYLNLFDEQPQLIKEIPLKYIASYIGITPQALSRIRARIS